MKKLIFLGLLVISGQAIFAQDRHDHDHRDAPPPQVQQSFRRDNPRAGDAKWMQANNQWHAEYPDRANNNRNADAYYDKKGRHVDTHVEWDRAQVPRNVDSRIYTRYHTRDYKVYKIQRPNNLSLFQVILSLGGSNKTVYVDNNGNEVRYNDRH